MARKYKYTDARIAIFAKAPIAGQTKTRMQPELSPAQSAALQEKLVQHISQLSAASALCPVELWCTPDTKHPTFIDIASKHPIQLHQQIGNDLGERIWHTLQQHKKQTTLILGTDCPYLQTTDLDTLISAIKTEDKDIGIIPAHDGGYVALSCQANSKALFHNIDWGSERVYAQTIAAAEANKLKIKALAPLSDIDRHADYVEMCKNIPNLQI